MLFTGLSITTQTTAIAAAIRTVNQLGGRGDVYNHALAIPGHLQYAGSPVSSLEYVTMAPSRNPDLPTMIGSHEQATDEIYFIVLGGKGMLTTNGEEQFVAPGDLVIAPRGTRHSLRNMTDSALGFLVVEIAAQDEHRKADILRKPAFVNLRDFLSPSWGAFSLNSIPAGKRITSCENIYDQNLFVVMGNATLLIHDEQGEEVLRENTEGFGLNAYIPKGVKKTVMNRSSRDPLIVLMLDFLPARSEQ